jgi:uncharacterized membrane protein HdeD (DUF308 family)
MPTGDQGSEFRELAEKRSTSFLGELLGFLRENKKWWLVPVLAVLVLLAGLVLLGGTAVAPFIYTIF